MTLEIQGSHSNEPGSDSKQCDPRRIAWHSCRRRRCGHRGRPRCRRRRCGHRGRPSWVAPDLILVPLGAGHERVKLDGSEARGCVPTGGSGVAVEALLSNPRSPLDVPIRDIVERLRAALSHPVQHRVGVADLFVPVLYELLVGEREQASRDRSFIQSIDVEVARDLDDKELRSIDQNKGMCWLLSAGCHAAGSQPAAKPQSIARDKASSIFPANVSFS